MASYIADAKSDLKIQYAVIVVALGFVGRFAYALYHARRRIIDCSKNGLGMPPHHPILGHLLVAQKVLSKIPSDAHPLYMPIHMRREYPECGEMFYIDLWPFSNPFLVVASPTAAYQLQQEHPQPKADVVRNFMYPLTGNHDLITMEGRQWKEWRNVYSPGFSAAHLMTLVPQILEQVVTYTQVIEEHVKAQDIFQLEAITINLTSDVIGIVTLGSHFNAQRSDNPFITALRNIIPWLPSGAELSPFARWNVLRPFVHRYYNRQMEVYLRREIASCFKAHRDKDNRNAKTILGLAIDGYQSSKESKDSTELDQTFIPFAMAQMKGLILAGHGTTANTICYVYHNLSKHPTALASVRAEHAQILGPDPHATILQNPHVLNQLPFTLAVIKETLRLFPADSSPRRGNPDFFLRDESDKAYPTDKCLVWSMPQAIHRSPKWWPRPDEFIPERFLVPEGHELHPVKGAWRAFEFGPRNCVGQELALSEMKIVLALTIRRFSVQAAYEEWEEMKGMKPRDVAGEKAYQVLDGTNRPRGGFPCRVTLVDE